MTDEEQRRKDGEDYSRKINEACRFYEELQKADVKWMQAQIDSGIDLNAGLPFNLERDFVATFSYLAFTCCEDVEAIKLMVAAGGSISPPCPEGRHIIHDVVQGEGCLAILKYLLENGADVNDIDVRGSKSSVLHGAADFNSNPEVLQYLIDQGAVVDAEDSRGDTPLFCAVNGNSNNPKCIDVLIKAGADINHKDKSGNTPLHWLGYGYDNMRLPIKALIKHKPDALALNKDGENIWFFGFEHGKGYMKQWRVSLLYRYWRKAKRDQWEESLNA